MYKNKVGGEVNNDTMFDHIIYHWNTRRYQETIELCHDHLEKVRQDFLLVPYKD